VTEIGVRGQLLVQAAAAFFGAFFGFVSVAVKDSITRRRDRRKKHRNCLVTIEIDGNRALGLLHENLFEIQCITQAVTKHQDTANVPLPLNRCEQIPVNPTILDGLRNIDLVNDVFMYQENLRKFNGSVATLNRHFELFSRALLAQTVPHETYRVNLQRYVDQLGQLPPFINALIEETMRLVAGARVLLRQDKSILERFGLRRQPEKYGPRLTSEVADEVSVLRRELQEVSAKSKKRIDQIVGPKSSVS